MDIVDENKYNEIKNILAGCQNMSDAKKITDLYLKKNPSTKKIVYSLFHGKVYNGKYDSKVFRTIMEKIKNFDYYEDCVNMINDLYPNKNDTDVQFMTLIRIANKKKKNTDSEKIIKKTKMSEIIKQCPHCSEKYSGGNNISYVICGYQDTHKGFDWSGCQKDWCFTCGKKLCKSWNDDKLFLEPNRIHDSECCKNYAIKHNESYLNDYCHCTNKYVDRNINLH